MVKELQITQAPGRVVRRVYQLTTVEGASKPTLDIEGEFVYSVVGEGHTSGTDRVSIHRSGGMAPSAPSISGIGLVERVKIGYEAAATAFKEGGRTGKVVGAVVDALKQYTAQRDHYKAITSRKGRKAMVAVSADEVDASTVQEGSLDLSDRL